MSETVTEVIRDYYIQHYVKGNKNRWCYLGSYDKLPEEFKKALGFKDINT